MARENKLAASLQNAKKNSASDFDEKGLNAYLEKVGEKPFAEETHKKLKVQSVLLYQEDAMPLKQLKRYIEDQLDDGADVSTSKIFRALLHAAEPNDRFVEIYKALK